MQCPAHPTERLDCRKCRSARGGKTRMAQLTRKGRRKLARRAARARWGKQEVADERR